jgi:hypothetical protein
METAHRYTLEPYKGMNTRYLCPAPNCGKGKTFSRYIDTETGAHIHTTVGRCNRESNCAHHYTPKQYFEDNNISLDTSKEYSPRPVKIKSKPVSFIPVEIFKASLNTKALNSNHFVNYLINLFGIEIASQLVSDYFIASSKRWLGATTFWQIDLQGNIRTGKIMLYNPTTGKRIKEPFNHIHWAHKALKQPKFGLNQCFFGEHLINEVDKSGKLKPVAIVESEKTAVIASVYLPQFIWLAAGSLNNLKADKCNILKGRTVTLFPDLSKPKQSDLSTFEKWSNKAKELSHLAIFTVSELLELKANEAERKQGLDLADYLIKFDYRDFVKHHATEPAPPVQPIVEFVEAEPIEQPTPHSWEQDITELENHFSRITPPKHAIKLNQCGTINDCSKFIENHIDTVKANNGNQTYLPYLQRLQQLKKTLQSITN